MLSLRQWGMETPATLSREELYEAVWTTPVVQLAKRYGLSDVGLAKVCVRHQVPHPGLGYWAKKQHGKAEPRPRLPAVEDPKLKTIPLTECPVPSAQDGPKRFAEDDEINALIIAEREAPAVSVPDSLRSLHPLVRTALEDDNIRASEQRQRKPGMGWSGVVFEPRGSIARANISASKALKSRAYRVMSGLLMAAEERGYEVSGRPDSHQRTTFIKILGKTFDVRLYEPSFQRPHVLTEEERVRKAKYPNWPFDRVDYVASGQLCLQLRPESGSDAYWQMRDGERTKIEDRLNKFFIAALRRVDEDRTWEKEREREAAIRREAERKRLEEEERQRQAEAARRREEARAQALINEVGRWRQSREIREYLSEIRRVIAERGQVIQPGSELDTWMSWAERTAMAMDPLRPPDKE